MTDHEQQYAALGDWVLRAACRNQTTVMLMPEIRNRRDEAKQAKQGEARRDTTEERVRAAKRICWNCPVLQRCQAWALTSPDPCPYHVAGGMTPDERKRQRRTNNARPARS